MVMAKRSLGPEWSSLPFCSSGLQGFETSQATRQPHGFLENLSISQVMHYSSWFLSGLNYINQNIYNSTRVSDCNLTKRYKMQVALPLLPTFPDYGLVTLPSLSIYDWLPSPPLIQSGRLAFRVSKRATRWISYTNIETKDAF